MKSQRIEFAHGRARTRRLRVGVKITEPDRKLPQNRTEFYNNRSENRKNRFFSVFFEVYRSVRFGFRLTRKKPNRTEPNRKMRVQWCVFTKLPFNLGIKGQLHTQPWPSSSLLREITIWSPSFLPLLLFFSSTVPHFHLRFHHAREKETLKENPTSLLLSFSIFFLFFSILFFFFFSFSFHFLLFFSFFSFYIQEHQYIWFYI